MEYCDLEAMNGVFGFGFWVRVSVSFFDDLEMILGFFLFFFLFLFYVGYRMNTERGFSFLYCFFESFSLNPKSINMVIYP